MSDPADDPLFRHDAQQASQDATERVAQSIQDAAEVRALFDAASVRYTSIEPQSDGTIRVYSDADVNVEQPQRLFNAMRDVKFDVRHSDMERCWTLTRRV